MEGEKAKVFVGPDRICYVVPKKLLCERSSYFRPAPTGGLKEANTSESELPNIETNTFEAIVKWMMSGIIEAPQRGRGGVRSFIDERVQLLPIVQIYLAAQFLNNDELREAAARVFRRELVGEERVDPRFGTDELSDRDTGYLYQVSPHSRQKAFLDEKPGFSLELVNLVVKEDLMGDMREIVKKGLVQAVVTGGEFIGIYDKTFEKHPEFALEVIEEMQHSGSSHLCPMNRCEYTRYGFHKLKERRMKEYLYTGDDRHLPRQGGIGRNYRRHAIFKPQAYADKMREMI